MILNLPIGSFFPTSSQRYIMYEKEVDGKLSFCLQMELAEDQQVRYINFWFNSMADASGFVNRMRNAVDRVPSDISEIKGGLVEDRSR